MFFWVGAVLPSNSAIGSFTSPSLAASVERRPPTCFSFLSSPVSFSAMLVSANAAAPAPSTRPPLPTIASEGG